jgi:hypothetical protein
LSLGSPAPNLGRLRSGFVTATALAVGLVCAASASAAPIHIKPSMQGAGTIETSNSDPPYGCNNPEPFDVVTTCGEMTFDLAVTTITLVATPDDSPPGHWVFEGWAPDTCPDPIEDTCVITATPGEPTDPPAPPVMPLAVFSDSVPPTIESVTMTRPQTVPGRNAVQFNFTANEYATFECQLDAGERSGCPSGIDYLDLAPGSHTHTVWAIDGSGNESDPVVTPFAIEAPPVTPQPPPVTPPAIVPTLLFPRILGPSKVIAKVSRKRTFSLGAVRLKCPGVTTPCRASAVLKGRLGKSGKAVVLARKSLRVRPSSTVAVRLRLSRKAANALKHRRLKATAALTVKAPNVITRKDVAVVLRARRR